MNQNVRVIFTNKAEAVLTEVLKKYGLYENEQAILSKMEINKLPNEIKLQRMVESFAGQMITKNELKTFIAKVFRLNPAKAQSISNDVAKDLVLLLEIHPEEKFNDPDFREEISKKAFGEEEAKVVAEQILLEKIRGSRTSKDMGQGKAPASPVKKVEVQDVEKNAERLKKEREATARPGTTAGELQRKSQPDPYREAVD